VNGVSCATQNECWQLKLDASLSAGRTKYWLRKRIPELKQWIKSYENSGI